MRVATVGPDGFEPSPRVPKTETRGVGYAGGSVGRACLYIDCSETQHPSVSLPTSRNLHVNLHAGSPTLLAPHALRAGAT